MGISITFGSEHVIGSTCYLCNQAIEEEDLSRLVGGRKYKWVHGICFYEHEADLEWRARHPGYRIQSQQGDE